VRRARTKTSRRYGVRLSAAGFDPKFDRASARGLRKSHRAKLGVRVAELFVLASFSKLGYRLLMPDDEKLTPASPRDVETALALALTSGRSVQRAQAAEATAKVVAERLVAHLERAGFVIMRKPIPVGR
jgi:hypothetical protein